MKKYVLLYVDDEESNLISLSAVLKKVEAFEVHYASSAKEGLKWLLNNKVDLILLDIMMPEIDGFEMAAMVRSKPSLSDIPIIYITARNDENVVREAFQNGGDDYVSKPIHTEELIARIWMQIRLMTKKREISQKLALIEYMMEKQQSMVIVTDGHKLIKANTPFFKCSGYDSEEEFNAHYKEISLCFDEHADSKEVLMELLENAKKEKEASLITKIQFEHHPQPISVKADAVCMGNEQDVMITFTDIHELTEENEILRHDVTHDSLTGLYNRRRCDEELEHHCAQANRYNDYFSVIFFDIDDFKDINDKYGHPKGDEVLRVIAAKNIRPLRESDIACRFGGEEFLIILPQTKLEEASFVAEQMRKNIENETTHGLHKVTCSFGVTQYKQNDTPFSILERVDKVLYKAKSLGKNCVETI